MPARAEFMRELSNGVNRHAFSQSPTQEIAMDSAVVFWHYGGLHNFEIAVL
ncbi:hypothetical protein SynMVIR181_01600 [Synechococcus sp. MVIR-18-1]|nr:hypothetical protein SynMVIR181_01600 [Synechococcus sp. MVIR-18-1]